MVNVILNVIVIYFPAFTLVYILFGQCQSCGSESASTSATGWWLSTGFLNVVQKALLQKHLGMKPGGELTKTALWRQSHRALSKLFHNKKVLKWHPKSWFLTLKVEVCNFSPSQILYLTVQFPLRFENKIKASIILIQYIMLRYQSLHSFWWKESGDRNGTALPVDKIIMLNVCIFLIKMINRGTRFYQEEACRCKIMWQQKKWLCVCVIASHVHCTQ